MKCSYSFWAFLRPLELGRPWRSDSRRSRRIDRRRLRPTSSGGGPAAADDGPADAAGAAGRRCDCRRSWGAPDWPAVPAPGPRLCAWTVAFCQRPISLLLPNFLTNLRVFFFTCLSCKEQKRNLAMQLTASPTGGTCMDFFVIKRSSLKRKC